MPPRREIAGGCAEFTIRYSIPHHAPGTIVREIRTKKKKKKKKRERDTVSTLSAVFLLADCPHAWRAVKDAESPAVLSADALCMRSDRQLWQSSFLLSPRSCWVLLLRTDTHPAMHEFHRRSAQPETSDERVAHLWFHGQGRVFFFFFFFVFFFFFFNSPNGCRRSQGGARVPLCGAQN